MGVASPTIRAPSGAAPMKLVLLSIVVVSTPMQHSRPGAEFVANSHLCNDLIRRGADNLNAEKCCEWQRFFL
jgi:hypothetical protein